MSTLTFEANATKIWFDKEKHWVIVLRMKYLTILKLIEIVALVS